MADLLTILGSPASPYTRKVVAALRYRRIPFRLIGYEAAADEALPQPRVRLLPTLYLAGADGLLEALTDSTPLLRRLEHEVVGRSLIPIDPTLRFLDELIEDYADEWLNKAMFHYRWSYPEDVDKASRVIVALGDVARPDTTLSQAAAQFAARQVSRLGLVGSTPTTGSLIEASYRRLLAALDSHLAEQPFVLGHSPSTADFALFGQLSQLCGFDPTPSALAASTAPRVCAWTYAMEDLSGHPGPTGVETRLACQPPTLSALLTEIGRTYAPVMRANALAVLARSDVVRAEVDGTDWSQAPVGYQAKTLSWLRAAHAALYVEVRAELDPQFAQTGLADLFA